MREEEMSVYYVSVDGSDSQSGTWDHPFASLQYAHNLAMPGDTIYLRGGVYQLNTAVTLTNAGSSDAPITVQSYPGEKAVLDGSARTTGGYYQGWVVDMNSASWNVIRDIEIRNGAEGGIVMRGTSNNNLIENLDVHHNGRLSESEGKGIVLTGSGANNLLLNNDSHHNHDINSDDADGFAISPTGAGNVLLGNRAWANSDDGFDFFNGQNGTESGHLVVEGNWAFGNGYDANHNSTGGDGNGFKLGGARPDTNTISGGHLVVGNVAWDNRVNGFDENQATQPLTLSSNIAYNNGMYNYFFLSEDHTFRSNLSFGKGDIAVSELSQNNVWTLPAPEWFINLLYSDENLVLTPRSADGSLPITTLSHLTEFLNLIDCVRFIGIIDFNYDRDLYSVESLSVQISATDSYMI
jgi:hypothetical protein